MHASCADRVRVRTNRASCPKDTLDAAQSDADLAVADKKERRRVHLASGETDLFDLLVSLNSQKGCRCHAGACFALSVVNKHFCGIILSLGRAVAQFEGCRPGM